MKEVLSRIAKFAATRARKSLSPLVLIAALHLTCAQTCQAAAATEYSPTERPVTTSPTEQPKRVLMLFAEDQAFPMISTLGQSIRSILTKTSASRIEFYNEYLDRTRINDTLYERELVNFWRKKYEGRRVDLVIVCIASTLDLLTRQASDLFAGAPIVYCVLFEEELSRIKPPAGATGVWSAKPFRPTIELALKLHPDTRRG